MMPIPIDVSCWIQAALYQSLVRSDVRHDMHTSKWQTPAEMSTWGLCAEAAERYIRRLPLEPAFELTSKGQTGVPDIWEDGWRTEIKVATWARGKQAEVKEEYGHTWVDTRTQSDYLMVYSIYRCISWPRFDDPDDGWLWMRRCADGCGHPHLLHSRGWLTMDKVRSFPQVSGKGGKGYSYKVPISNLCRYACC